MNAASADAYIERQPVDYGPQDEDRCPVCSRIDCVCPPDAIEVHSAAESFSEWLTSRNDSLPELDSFSERLEQTEDTI